jgi:uncharacterized protein (TIGR03437 family)
LIGIAGGVCAQVTLNPRPSRALGQPRLLLNRTEGSVNPNLVEGRELYLPQVVALDNNVSPPVLYVSDTLNNRVLAWRNAADFANGAKADFVIGQKDFYSTQPLGPGTPVSSGLTTPNGLAVDRSGNLYVIDAGNNRILRYPRPYTQQFEQLPDRVIGQTNFNSSGSPNSGGVSAKSLATSVFGQLYSTGLAFDPQGNLWATDSANNRVLRYPVSALNTNNPAADLVLGQPDFNTNTLPPSSYDVNGALSKSLLYNPSSLAFDTVGRLYVSDSMQNRDFAVGGRVLVYDRGLSGPFGSGNIPSSALRIMGIPIPAPGQRTLTVPNEVGFVNPSVFMIGDSPGVVDNGNHRILLFPPFGVTPEWPTDGSSPHARNVGPIGQNGYNPPANRPNRDQGEPSERTLNSPSSAVASGNELFVADSANHRVLVFPLAGLGQSSGATRVLGQDAFYLRAPNLTEGREMQFVPFGSLSLTAGAVVIDSSSDVPHLYVSDTWNNRVLGFRDARNLRPGDKADLVIGQADYQRTIANSPGADVNSPTARGLYLPIGLALDVNGNLYVADSGNGRVVRFAKPFDSGRGDYPSADLVLGQSDFTSKLQVASSRTMSGPYGIAFASDNGLLVSDSALNRVLFFAGNASTFSSGMQASKVFGQQFFGDGDPGVEDNRMNAPKHIATDTDDRLYVADEGNARILIFDRAPFADSNPRAGTKLTGPTPNNGFSGLRGISVSKTTGEIWTAELSGRLLRFPKFDDLFFLSSQANFQISTNSSSAICQDSFGDVYTTEGTNRVAIYFPGLTAKNGANYISGRAVAPGTITYVEALGSKFSADEVIHDGDSWPLSLNDVQVLVGDTPAPLNWVYPGKLSFLMPNSAQSSGTVEVQVMQQSTGQILAVGQVDMAPASPALFTAASTGSGQVLAYNDDGAQNQRGAEISRGHVIQLYGTGAGYIPGAPPDGQPPTDMTPTDLKPRVFMGSAEVTPDNISYSGLAPGLVGVWRIDVKVPDTVAPGPTVVVLVQMRSIISTQAGQVTTIAVKQ